MAKKIIAVGIDHFPADDGHKLITCASFKTHLSLADADIIILGPGPSSSDYYGSERYMGKDCLSDDASGRFSDDRTFWKKEVSKAMDSGKTIFILSEKPDEFYFATGERQHSGTGRNRQTTRVVSSFNSYSIFPFPTQKIHAAAGSEIAYRGSNSVLRTLWEENQDYFHYQVSYDTDVFKAGAVFFQKKGKDVLGGIIPTSAGGNIVVLPALELEHPDFTETKKDPKTGEDRDYWSKKAIAFTNGFVKSIIEIDKVFASQNVLTPPPPWSQAAEFAIDTVTEIENEIAATEKKIDELQSMKVKLQGDKDLALQPKRLLFETGKPLENAIRSALRVMGFSAEPFQDSESEFDVIFRSGEGDFLGEVEGKDNKAVDVTKISQLIRNQTEYISKENVDTPAKGVLFGNGCRLKAPKERATEFTEKCIKVSAQSNIALVRTSDLFPIVKYLNSNTDEIFKQRCREAILNAKGGVVSFPPVPGADVNG